MKLIETYSDIEREVKQDKINNFIDQFVFSNSLRRHGGPMLIFWEWIIAVPHEDVYDEEFKKRQWVFKLRSSTSPIPHSPHKDDPYFILNNKVVEYVSEGLGVSDDESRQFLIDWFITNIYNDKEFKKEYIENFIYGMAKKRDNLIMGPIEKQKLKRHAKNMYDVLIPQYIQLALKPQNYAENSFSYRINEEINQNIKTLSLGTVIKIEKGSYTATGKYSLQCDELHAFESTSEEKVVNGKKEKIVYPIGEVHTKIRKVLIDLYKQGYNPKVSKFEIVIKNGWTVDWTATIEQSDDAYIGFTSRGSGCNDTKQDGLDRTNSESGKSESDVKASIEKNYGKIGKIINLTDLYGQGGDKKYFHQRFWIYTQPNEFPKNNENKTKLTNLDDYNF